MSALGMTRDVVWLDFQPGRDPRFGKLDQLIAGEDSAPTPEPKIDYFELLGIRRCEPLPEKSTVSSIEFAESDGYMTGLADIHHTRQWFRTSEEWAAWRAGHARGWAEYRGSGRSRYPCDFLNGVEAA